MPTVCEVDNFYLGSVGPIEKLYAGSVLIWPCYDCSHVDPEFALPIYADAVAYVPQACIPATLTSPYKTEDAVSHIHMTEGLSYNGVFSVGGLLQTFGYSAPTVLDDIVVEADLGVTDVGVDTSSASFYISIHEETTVDNQGLLLKMDQMEVELVVSTFGGTTILARANRSLILGAIECTATVDLALDTETFVMIYFANGDTSDRIAIYFNEELVGEEID